MLQEHWTLAHMLRWPDDKVDVMSVIDKMAFIVNGSIRRATLTTTINIEDNECQTSQDATEQ